MIKRIKRERAWEMLKITEIDGGKRYLIEAFGNEGKEFIKLMKWTGKAVSTDTARLALQVYHFEGNRIVGVDGFRVHELEIKENHIKSLIYDQSFPSGDFWVKYAAGMVILTREDVKYPNYKVIIDGAKTDWTEYTHLPKVKIAAHIAINTEMMASTLSFPTEISGCAHMRLGGYNLPMLLEWENDNYIGTAAVMPMDAGYRKRKPFIEIIEKPAEAETCEITTTP